MPEDEIYLPVFVGASISKQNISIQRDDEGDNISEKNPYYSELTGLYWAYKNLKADYLGLCHYPRYLNLKNLRIENYDVILPKKRNYYIECIYDQFKHAHSSVGLDIAREVIEKDFNGYLGQFDKYMAKTSGHICNIFIMKYDVFIDYCDFLFNLLFKIEERLGNVNRLYGYISERLLDVYLDKNTYKCKETKIIETEQVNWPIKILCFLKRKYKK